MLEVLFLPKFIKQYNSLEKNIANEVLEKIGLFRNPIYHSQLKVHKLKGKFSNCHSFSVNYKFRIIFQYLSKKEVVLLTVGDHGIYKP